MKSCTVIFEGNVSDHDVAALINAIQQLKGVARVDGFGQPTAGYNPQPGYSPNQQPGYSPNQQPGYPPNQQPGYPPNQQAGYPPNQQAGYPPNQPPPGAMEDAFSGLEKPDSQRLLLQKAIQWGIKNGHLTINEMSSLSAEETVQKAMDFIDQMNPQEKQALTNEVARQSKPQ